MSIFYALFIGICVLAAFTDFLYFKIPNVLVVALLALFITKVLLWQNLSEIYFPASVFGAMLVVGFILYTFKIFGAGDAKFLAAAAMWASEVNIVAFLVFTALAGGVVGLLYLWLGKVIDSTRSAALGYLPKGFSAKLMKSPAQEVVVKQIQEGADLESMQIRAIPYGIAICIGSVMLITLAEMR